MKTTISRDDVNDEYFPADARLKAALESIAAETDTSSLAVRVRLTYLERGWWSAFHAPGDAEDPPLEVWEMGWACIPPRSPSPAVPTIRMRMDARYLDRQGFVHQCACSLRFGGFLDVFGFVFARQLYRYRRRCLGLHPAADAIAVDKWAIRRLLQSSLAVEEI
jgi:hypothetical protein